eukprot:jgi/Picsp_1/936/NSC_04421-R1_ubiquinone biosynthesis protein
MRTGDLVKRLETEGRRRVGQLGAVFFGQIDVVNYIVGLKSIEKDEGLGTSHEHGREWSRMSQAFAFSSTSCSSGQTTASDSFSKTRENFDNYVDTSHGLSGSNRRTHRNLESSSSHQKTGGSVLESLLLLNKSQRHVYETHVPLSGFQKGMLSVLASWGAFQDPRRADLVAVVGETTGVGALHGIRKRMLQSEEGRLLLKERPRVTDESVGKTFSMAPDTFGGAYAEFMGQRGFRADERPPVRFVDDPELAWIAARSREIHDFWHVLFGCHTNVLGEAALKGVEFLQTGLPMTAMAVLAAEWRLKSKSRRSLNTVYLPWALRAGSQAADLMCIYYENHFEERLEDVREKWRILPAPTL